MGRYYSGDIEGKFAFGIQSSNAADRFGAPGTTPGYLEYWFSEDNLDEVIEELKRIKPAYVKVKRFSKHHNSYSDDTLKEAGISRQEMSDYADYMLGKKIRDCIQEQGECSFTAEL